MCVREREREREREGNKKRKGETGEREQAKKHVHIKIVHAFRSLMVCGSKFCGLWHLGHLYELPPPDEGGPPADLEHILAA